MELTRRFIFHGDACSFSGRIIRPVDVVLESSGSSTLPVTGGRLRTAHPRAWFGKFVRFGSTSTLAEGLFDNPKKVLAASHGRLREDELTATTRVNAGRTKSLLSWERAAIRRLQVHSSSLAHPETPSSGRSGPADSPATQQRRVMTPEQDPCRYRDSGSDTQDDVQALDDLGMPVANQ